MAVAVLARGRKEEENGVVELLIAEKLGKLEMLWHERRERRAADEGSGAGGRRQWRHVASATHCREIGADRWANPLSQCTL
jgi:hypothetical protein